MAFSSDSLQDWLDWQQRVHPREMEFGLDRVGEVWRLLGAPQPARVVISVGGTNGKGSTVAFLAAILGHSGQRVGAFTSPHLLRYNERVRIDGKDVDDATLVDAFDRIERARGTVALTYFEFGTLAALWIFAQAALDVAVLEVGLGGRLDAVNLVDADAAIVTTIDLDHQAWLGSDRDSIGREKAGIFRAGRPAIVGETAPPAALIAHALAIGADLRIAGRDFHYERDGAGEGWQWRSGTQRLTLPEPGLVAPTQIGNAAAAIAAVHALRDRLGWDAAAIAEGVATARLPARLQRFGGTPELVVDVAHNPQAARELAAWLRAVPGLARTSAVFGVLDDKDAAGIVAALADEIDAWFLAGLDAETSRGLDAASLRERIAGALAVGASVREHNDVSTALEVAFAHARPRDRVIAFGSFFVAADALRFAATRSLLRR